MYILQNLLFSFNELMKYEPISPLEKIFSKIDLTPAIAALPKPSQYGPRGYSRESLFKAMLGKAILCIQNFTALTNRLRTDIVFRYVCGFDVIGATPSVSTLSRFYTSISESEALSEFFNSLVQRLRDENVIHEEVVPIDSSSIEAYESPRNKSRKRDGSMAAWGHKKDSKGQPYTWFGYKAHAGVDADSGLPVSLVVTSANVVDSDMAIPVMEKVPFIPKYSPMDMGYDVGKIYDTFLDIGCQAIIPLNKRNEKTPPEGMDEKHWPICSMGYRMTYWGSEEKRGTVKFRCPHICGQVDCPQGSFWCCSSNYGYARRLKREDDARNISLPYRGSDAWNKLYTKRTSAERFFSTLKDRLNVEKLYVRGISKVTAHVFLCATALMVLDIAQR